MKYLFTIMAALLLVGLPASAYAQESAEGEITGQVVNGTEGGGSVAGITITLITYVDDIASSTRNTTTDGEGNFHFENIIIDYRYNNNLKKPRLGITVSSKQGKAILRNKFKRMIREAFRLNKNNFSNNLEINVLGKSLRKDMKYFEIEKEYLTLLVSAQEEFKL